MEEKRTSVFENSLIWFGAAVSIAEILTGTYLAPLGFRRGLMAILLGHLIGCSLLFLAGLASARVRKGAMDTAKMSFGSRGSNFFALMNILQLVGWTGIMIYDGALAADEIFTTGRWLWCLIIAALIILWILIGPANLGKLNTVAMGALFVLTVILCIVIYRKSSGAAAVPADSSISFGAGVELSVAMPLSWLPLIGDYTQNAAKPVKATAGSALTYGVVSCWMYVIGMSAAIFTGESDIAAIMVRAGLGLAGLLIIIFSTVTTTFLDAYSAGVSSESVNKKFKGKRIAVAATVMGCVGAIIYPMDNITNFLYLIGSVFAPMIAIQITDSFIFKQDNSEQIMNLKNMIIWVLGFLLYRYLMTLDIVVGNTLPDMVIVMLLCVAVEAVLSGSEKQSQTCVGIRI